MSIQQKTQTYPIRPAALPVGAVTAMGLAGAVIGGTVAAAKDLRQVKEGDMTREAAAGHILKEAVGTGLATAVGAVAGTFFRSSILGLAAMAAVGIGTKYIYDGVTGLAVIKAKAAKAAAKPAAKTTAKTETAKAPAKG
ncbi:magnetosome protein MamC [Desulfolutivibrio sulfoxidireducens]|uniref:magnetosome protein MamC n=1 Tax=Desulfolutivibrio sulfoxidireducens TaxID=2773299 RepID=UPI00159E50B8|nr:magnetosome protein MamC [Desulfolutivibrio sulfoxidireducens]